MARPSEPLLAWLRDMLKTKGLNTAHVADASGIARARIRKILAGTDDMTVDELMMLSDALQLDPADLTSATLPKDVAPKPVEAVSTGPNVDPWGNQPEQLFQIAFALGCDFFFLADTSELADSGIPASVLEQYRGRELPIKLDAQYHKYNDPRYSVDGVTLTLSFDALYECSFRWSCIRQFVLFPVAPEPTNETDHTDDVDAPPAGVPHLRLVT
jgi:transcriptional regulator with XRE-family HTH domain